MRKKLPIILNRIIAAALAASAAIHLVLGIWWLAVGFIVLLGAFYLGVSPNRRVRAFRNKSLLSYPLLFAGLFILAISLRVLVFGIYFIPSTSMQQTIIPGDVVWVNKLLYGPALPRTPYEIPWINLVVWLAERPDADIESPRWGHKRLKGYTKAKAGDIVVFDNPLKGDVTIKRCIGLPGDTIQIINGKVFVNNEPFEEPEGLIRPAPGRGFSEAGENGVATGVNRPSSLQRSENAERTETEKLLFPFCENIEWTLDDFGPLILPKRGKKINLNNDNYVIYNKLLNNNIETNNGGFFLNGEMIDELTFTQDYYFMLGDNRYRSIDSRHFGPVPCKNIAGKATIILFNYKNGRSRILKSLY